MRVLPTTALAPLALAALACAAGAEDYCVTCTEPDAKYRCVIDAPAPPPAEHQERGPLLCITELAQSGSHASCSVGAATSAPCEGNLRTVKVPADSTIAAPVPLKSPGEAEPPAESAAATAAAPEPAPEPEGPPKTVEEFAKKTAKASGDGIKQAGKAVTDTAQSAGNAVGNAAKKTWDCLSSFFGDC